MEIKAGVIARWIGPTYHVVKPKLGVPLRVLQEYDKYSGVQTWVVTTDITAENWKKVVESKGFYGVSGGDYGVALETELQPMNSNDAYFDLLLPLEEFI